MPPKTLTAMDCQGFAGGFSLGVVNAGFKLIGKREKEGGFGVPLMEGNRHLLGTGWEAEACDPSDWTPKKADLVFGNPPCSGFSSRSTSIRRYDDEGILRAFDFRGVDSSVNQCMWDLVTYAVECEPTTIIFESVQGAGRAGLPLMRALWEQVKNETGEDWTLTHTFHNNLSVGGAAMRKRYFFVLSKKAFGVEPVNLVRVPVLKDTIGDLQRKKLGSIEGHVGIRSKRTSRMEELASKVDWYSGEKSGHAYARAAELGVELLEPVTGTDGGTGLKEDGVVSGTSPFAPRRLFYDKPAPVMTGKAVMEDLHPVLPRFLTHREVARIMGFPDDWSAAPAIAKSGGYMWWGKGIPVKSGEWVAEWASKSMRGKPGSISGEEIADGEFVIDLTNDWKRAL